MNLENNNSIAARLLHMFKNMYYGCTFTVIDIRNGEIKLSGTVHGSVGIDYEIVYPELAFLVTDKKFKYISPEMVKLGMCGGDEAIVEYILKPRKRGLFKVYEVLNFRGDLEKRLHRYLVV